MSDFSDSETAPLYYFISDIRPLSVFAVLLWILDKRTGLLVQHDNALNGSEHVILLHELHHICQIHCS